MKPVPGWTVNVATTKLATPITTDDGQVTEGVSKITWTSASGIQPGEFQEFEVSMGPLPDTDQMIFKVLQYYSTGDIVRWIDETTRVSPNRTTRRRSSSSPRVRTTPGPPRPRLPRPRRPRAVAACCSACSA